MTLEPWNESKQRHVIFQMAEVAVSREMFAAMNDLAEEGGKA